MLYETKKETTRTKTLQMPTQEEEDGGGDDGCDIFSTGDDDDDDDEEKVCARIPPKVFHVVLHQRKRERDTRTS